MRVALSAAGLVPVTSGAVPAFERVYEEHFDFVWRSLRRLGVPRSALDDAVQEVFLVVHRRLAEFEGRSSLKTWLFGIAVHIALKAGRASARGRAEEFSDQLSRLRAQFIHGFSKPLSPEGA